MGQSWRLNYLRVLVPGLDRTITSVENGLTIDVVIVDPTAPVVPAWVRSAVTIIGISAGAATAEQLACAATAIADAGGNARGILVADPDPADDTTGLDPRLGEPRAGRMPSRLRGGAMEMRR